MPARTQIGRYKRDGKPPPKVGNSEAHLERVRQCSCIVCAKAPRNEPHHLKRTDEQDERLKHGMANRTRDRWALPMCRKCHRAVEESRVGEEAWFAERQIMARETAKALWRAHETGEGVEQYERIVGNERANARLKLRSVA